MSYNLPGFGDIETWGPVWHPNDPRQEDLPEDSGWEYCEDYTDYYFEEE